VPAGISRWFRAHFRDAEGIELERVMTKAVWSAVAALGVMVCVAAPAHAQATANGSVNVTANVSAKAKLTLGAASITFADADPDVTPSISAAALSVDVKARTSASGSVTLTVLASGDLASGGDSIAVGNLTWTATGSGFQAGTSNKTTAQTVGGWTGSGNPSGTQTYALANSWSYATGTYTVTLNYTLTAP
jgi:hypothetical protein